MLESAIFRSLSKLLIKLYFFNLTAFAFSPVVYNNGAYVLKDVDGDILDRHVPIDQIKLISKTTRAKDADTYTVYKVLKHRGAPGAYEYLIHWKGYSQDDSTWEPESHFNDDKCITKYWSSLNTSSSL